ncbi:MAG: hypothetical protein AAGA33_00740 [Pseudomonadota bacterium]
MRRRTRGVLFGTLLAPVPMLVLPLLVVAVVVGFDVPVAVGVVFACLLTWLPLVVSYVALRLLRWTSRKAHLAMMFVVTFLPVLGVYLSVDFRPDAQLSAQVGGGTVFAAFSITGVVIALIAAAVNSVGMALFYRNAVLACAAADPPGNPPTP